MATKSDIYGLGAVMYHVCTIVQRANKAKPYDSMEWEINQNLNFVDLYNPEDFLIAHDYRGVLKTLIEKMLNPMWN